MRARLSAVLVLLLTTTVAFAQTTSEWYVGKTIKDFSFEGLNHIKVSELEGITDPYKGRFFDDQLFWEIQGKLYALEFFDLISPTAVPGDADRNSVILKFKVSEKPVVSRIVFEGNSGVRKNELLDSISIKVDEVVNTLKLRQDEQAIRDKYLEKGYPDISVRSELKAIDTSSQSLTFYIQEGEKIAIEDFRFEGNKAFSEKTLRGLLSLKSKGLLNDGAFQEVKLSTDKEAILNYYKDRGYVDVALTDVQREVRKDDEGNNLLTLVFHLTEGKQYTYGGMTFEGNKIFSNEDLSKLLYLKPGDVLNYKRLEADYQGILDLYYENGYIFNTINRKEIRDPEALSISYSVIIVERSRAHIENIVIRGNEKTKESVILREIPLEPGDIFSKTKVLQGLRNLYNLQYFSTVSPETPQGSDDNLMDLVFNVEEQPTADVQFGLTFSGVSSTSSFPISGLVKWSDKNFLGNGNTFSVELTGSPTVQKLAFSYTERWLFGQPLSGAFDFTISHSTEQTSLYPENGNYLNGDEEYAYPLPYTSYEEYYEASKAIPDAYLMEYDELSFSVGFSSGYRFATALGTLGLGGGLRTGLVKDSYDSILYRPLDPALREGNNEWLLTNSFSANISLDQRDLYYDPSKGYYAIQRASYVGVLPFEKEHYIKTDTKLEAYATLFNIPIGDSYHFKGVFAAHAGLSLIHPQFADDPVIKNANKLYIDGMFYARGWTDLSTDKGLALWENWAEIRMPVAPGILALDWFLDGAALKSTVDEMVNDISVDDFYFSLGAGLRFTIPQFPFRFSLAKRFKVQNDGTVEWQEGDLWQSSHKNSGMDFVISFALSTY